jgi:hypothetical protein
MILILLWRHVSLSTYSGNCVIRHTKGPGKWVGLYRMSEYSGFILVNRNTSETINFCRMSQDVGKLSCRIAQVPLYIYSLCRYSDQKNNLIRSMVRSDVAFKIIWKRIVHSEVVKFLVCFEIVSAWLKIAIWFQFLRYFEKDI